jgi:hypothetical protein
MPFLVSWSTVAALREKPIPPPMWVMAVDTSPGFVSRPAGIAARTGQQVLTLVTAHTNCRRLVQQHVGSGGAVMMMADQTVVDYHWPVDVAIGFRQFLMAGEAQAFTGRPPQLARSELVASIAPMLSVRRMGTVGHRQSGLLIRPGFCSRQVSIRRSIADRGRGSRPGNVVKEEAQGQVSISGSAGYLKAHDSRQESKTNQNPSCRQETCLP